ncbi:predicted protein [Naegleria gruberi]|uniref:Predicted protein n=1 Tax=Naegleria gruberi TaxID=5762 RepID=D2VW22_NAEGR|nr:uncharacterized protein NAEGRDRAFT_52707 [Naegleria gruberi]EFC38939.1 predicted protein [Naegleria gruberi]|eukprot:XP_002671683.1 predicted protein [Naegleria gruberi strain NEG-M]
MSKTLVFFFHERFESSQANRSMIKALSTLDNIEIVNMHQIFTENGNKFDSNSDIQRLLNADRIIFQFPIQWYSMPAFMKQWIDETFTRMYYIRYGEEGLKMEGKKFMISVTAGNFEEAYTPQGQNLIPLDDLLNPLKALAHRCKLQWSEPFISYRANKKSVEELEETAEQYRQFVSKWMEKY